MAREFPDVKNMGIIGMEAAEWYRPHNGTCQNLGAKTRLRLDETLAGNSSYAQGRRRHLQRDCAGQTTHPSKITSPVSATSARLEYILKIWCASSLFLHQMASWGLLIFHEIDFWGDLSALVVSVSGRFAQVACLWNATRFFCKNINSWISSKSRSSQGTLITIDNRHLL